MRIVFEGLHRNGWLTFLLVWLGLATVSVAWAFATPLAGTPDEASHLIKAASVAQGDILGTPTDLPGTTTVQVPAGFSDAHAWPCFRFQVDVTADCAPAIVEGTGLASAETSAGLYNPVYYTAVGWPSLMFDDTRSAIFGMRIISGLINAFFLAVAFSALLQFRRPFVTGLAFFAAVTPTAFFLAGAVNPNALEATAGCALLSLLLALLRAPNLRYERLQLTLVVISGFFLANSRGLSPLWMACIALACLVFAPPQRMRELLRLPRVWVTLTLLALSVAAAGLWVLRTDTLSAMGTFAGAGTTSPTAAFIRMLVDKSFDVGTVAVFGWLDTFVPNVIVYFWSSLFFGLVLTALALARGRVLASLGIMVAAFILVPPIAQAMAVTQSGYIWQGRYTLIAYACVILLSGVCLALFAPAFGVQVGRQSARRGLIAVALLLVGGQCLSMMVAIKRYAVGASPEWTTLIADQRWAPPGGLFLWPVVLVVGMVLVIGIWVNHISWSVRHAEGLEREELEVPVQASGRGCGEEAAGPVVRAGNTQYLNTK